MPKVGVSTLFNHPVSSLHKQEPTARRNDMKITEVSIYPVNEERLKAYVTITIENCFVVRDLKIIRGNNGLFVAMPSKKRKDGQFKDIAHPLDQDTRSEIETAIFEAYENEIKSMGESLDDLKASSES